MGRYRSIQSKLIEAALKGITDNQTVTENIYCEDEEKPLASEVIADQQEEIENLKAELQETKKKRDFWHSYASNQLRKLDIINFIIQLYSEKTINFLYGVAKSSFQNQKEQEQEEENRWKDVY